MKCTPIWYSRVSFLQGSPLKSKEREKKKMTMTKVNDGNGEGVALDGFVTLERAADTLGRR